MIQSNGLFSFSVSPEALKYVKIEVLCSDFLKQPGSHQGLMILQEINFNQPHLHRLILIYILPSLQIIAGQFVYMHLHILNANGFV